MTSQVIWSSGRPGFCTPWKWHSLSIGKTLLQGRLGNQLSTARWRRKQVWRAVSQSLPCTWPGFHCGTQKGESQITCHEKGTLDVQDLRIILVCDNPSAEVFSRYFQFFLSCCFLFLVAGQKPAQPDLEGHRHGSKEEGEKSVDQLSAKLPVTCVCGVLSWAMSNLMPSTILLLS